MSQRDCDCEGLGISEDLIVAAQGPEAVLKHESEQLEDVEPLGVEMGDDVEDDNGDEEGREPVSCMYGGLAAVEVVKRGFPGSSVLLLSDPFRYRISDSVHGVVDTEEGVVPPAFEMEAFIDNKMGGEVVASVAKDLADLVRFYRALYGIVTLNEEVDMRCSERADRRRSRKSVPVHIRNDRQMRRRVRMAA